MDSDVVGAIGSLASGVTAIVALVIAVFAWRTSVNAANAAKALTRIEQTRLHGERRPEFDLTVERLQDEEQSFLLRATLVGPKAVLSIQRARFVMQPLQLPMLPDGRLDKTMTPIDILAYDFEPMPGSGMGSTATEAMEVQIGRSILGWVTPSRSPQGQVLIKAGLPKLSFTIECVTDGFEPWIIASQVVIPPRRVQSLPAMANEVAEVVEG